MAETRYTDSDKPEPGTAEAVEAEFEVELAGLNDSEAAQVTDAISEAEFAGELAEFDVDAEIQNAQVAEEHREEAEQAQRDQAEAVDAGDYGAARENAEQVQENLAEAEAQGASLDEATQDNDADVEVLEAAEYQQDTAEEFADASLDSVEDGVYEADSDMMDDYAADAADQADDYAQQGDQDGYYGDQSIHTDNAQ